MPFTIAAKYIKNIGRNLAKDGQDLDGINCFRCKTFFLNLMIREIYHIVDRKTVF